MRPQLALVSALSEYVFASNEAHVFQQAPPPLDMHTKYHALKIYCANHPVFKSIKSVGGDHGMDGCHYAVNFKDIS